MTNHELAAWVARTVRAAAERERAIRALDPHAEAQAREVERQINHGERERGRA